VSPLSGKTSDNSCLARPRLSFIHSYVSNSRAFIDFKKFKLFGKLSWVHLLSSGVSQRDCSAKPQVLRPVRRCCLSLGAALLSIPPPVLSSWFFLFGEFMVAFFSSLQIGSCGLLFWLWVFLRCGLIRILLCHYVKNLILILHIWIKILNFFFCGVPVTENFNQQQP